MDVCGEERRWIGMVERQERCWNKDKKSKVSIAKAFLAAPHLSSASSFVLSMQIFWLEYAGLLFRVCRSFVLSMSSFALSINSFVLSKNSFVDCLQIRVTIKLVPKRTVPGVFPESMSGRSEDQNSSGHTLFVGPTPHLRGNRKKGC